MGSDRERSPAGFKKVGSPAQSLQGPTTITILISQRAPELGIETNWFIVSLPQYVVLEEDYLERLDSWRY